MLNIEITVLYSLRMELGTFELVVNQQPPTAKTPV